MIAIAPSILAADFARLGDQVRDTESGGADRIHVDVMDGHFVPNLSMGPAIAQCLRPVTRLPLEVHLMVQSPAKFAEPFRHAGVNTIIVHHEVLPDPRPLMNEIRKQGCKVGIAINPATPIDVLEPYLPELDVALCMTVWPGFGGQSFLPDSPDRIRKLRQLIDRINPKCDLEVDGGIDLATAEVAVAAGANVLVAGTSVFHAASGPKAAMEEFCRRFAGR